MRSKASSESTALTASLRKEQMKNESLEQALLHKVYPSGEEDMMTTLQPIFHLPSVLCFVTLPPFMHPHRIKRLKNSQRSAMS